MNTGNLTQNAKEALGAELADNIDKSKFNDMVGRILKHGHMYDNPAVGKTYWAQDQVGVSSLLSFVQDTLSDPDQVFPKNGTRLLYVKNFAPSIVGYEQSNGQSRTKVAVVIDLATVPDNIDLETDPASALDQVGLIVAYPTN